MMAGPAAGGGASRGGTGPRGSEAAGEEPPLRPALRARGAEEAEPGARAVGGSRAAARLASASRVGPSGGKSDLVAARPLCPPRGGLCEHVCVRAHAHAHAHAHVPSFMTVWKHILEHVLAWSTNMG